MNRTSAVLLALPLLIVACAAHAVPASPPSSGSSGAQSGSSDTSPSPASSGAGVPQKGASVAELRGSFMSTCSQGELTSPEYCECSWQQTTKTFSMDELAGPAGVQNKYPELESRSKPACLNKLPDAAFKNLFLKSCSGSSPALSPFCECHWGELRKTISLADFADTGLLKSERYHAAAQGAVKVCGGKIPEAFVKSSFMEGCAEDPKLTPFCECAWKEIRKNNSPAEINAGLIDMESMKPKINAACKK